jgi:hypothetical protein
MRPKTDEELEEECLEEMLVEAKRTGSWMVYESGSNWVHPDQFRYCRTKRLNCAHHASLYWHLGDPKIRLSQLDQEIASLQSEQEYIRGLMAPQEK